MPRTRPGIPREMERAVLLQAGHRCAIPQCGATATEIAHISPYHRVRKHEFHNLIALCPNCHTRFDRGEIDRKSMLAYKARLPKVDVPPAAFAPEPPAAVGDADLAAMRALLDLQHPWGEWSDQRTALQYVAAERSSHLRIEGPKPNVARTLFAADALSGDGSLVGEERVRSALQWMRRGVRDGWYVEWAQTGPSHSEIDLPCLDRKQDVRHTAQVASALCLWSEDRDPLAAMVSSLAASARPDGLWPESPGAPTPRLLATIYSVEALGHVVAGGFRLPLEDLVDASHAAAAEDAFRRGVAALHRESDRGGGLLGKGFSGETPYLTGIALYRLASIRRPPDDAARLLDKLVEGLVESAHEDGWVDAAVSADSQEETRTRTTLRAAAGLAKARARKAPVPDRTWAHAVRLTKRLLAGPVDALDSPDYACALIVLQQEGARRLADLVGASASPRPPPGHVDRWRSTLQAHRDLLQRGLSLRLPGYDEVAKELDAKLLRLRA